MIFLGRNCSVFLIKKKCQHFGFEVKIGRNVRNLMMINDEINKLDVVEEKRNS